MPRDGHERPGASNVIDGLGGAGKGVPRETDFDITAASEVMVILCLAEDESDLRARLDRILVGFTYDGERVVAGRGIRSRPSVVRRLGDEAGSTAMLQRGASENP